MISVSDVILLTGLSLVGMILVAALRERIIDLIRTPFQLVIQPFLVLEAACKAAIAALAVVIAKVLEGLRYGRGSKQNNQGERSEWSGWSIIGPLVYLAAFIVVAMGSYVTLLRIAALYVIAVEPPKHLDLVLGIVWTGTIFVWGFVFLDFLGITPIRRPWDGFGRIGRLIGAIVSGLALLLSIAATVAVVLYGQGLVWDVPQTTFGWWFIGASSALEAGAVAAAGWATFCGLAALWALTLMAVSLILHVLLVLTVIVRRVIDGLSRIPCAAVNLVADLGRSLWNWLCSFLGAYLHLRSLPPAKRRSRIGDEPADMAEIEQEQEEVPMSRISLHRINVIVAFDRFGRGFLNNIRTAADYSGVTRTVLAIGHFDLSQAKSAEQMHFNRSGVADVSPTLQEVEETLAHSVTPALAWRRLIHRVVDKVIQVVLLARLAQGHMLWVQSLISPERDLVEEAVRELKKRLPNLCILPLVTLPQLDQGLASLKSAIDFFAELRRDHVIPVTFVFDAFSSPFAKAGSAELLVENVARAFADLLGAHNHHHHNPSLAAMAEHLGQYAAFVGMAFASAGINVSHEVGGYSFLRRYLKQLPPRGYGDLSDCVIQAQTATKEAFLEPNARAIDYAIDLSLPCIVLYTMPLRPDDYRWPELIHELRPWLANAFPTAMPVFVSSNGSPNRSLRAAYSVQCSIFYPLPDFPIAVQEAAGDCEADPEVN